MANGWTWSDEQRHRWREKRAEQYEADREREENEREEYPQIFEHPDPTSTERHAERRVYYRQDVGKFIMPEDAALITLLYYVRDPSYAISFSAEDHPVFDQIIAQRFNKLAFKEKHHPRYKEFEPLRNNIAAVRNYLYCYMFPDGSYDKSDEAKAPMLEEMAHEIGKALESNRKIFSLNPSLSLQQANTPSLGAAEIYKHLLKIQSKRTIRSPLAWVFGWPNKNWGLPPIALTPFGDLLRTNNAGSYTESIAESHAPQTGEALAALSEEMDMHAHNFNQLESLQQPAVDESVELAREIIDKMKMRLGPGLDDPWKSKNPEKALDQSNAFAHLTNTFEQYMAFSVPRDSGLRADQAFLNDARETVGKLSGIIKKEASKALSGEGKEAAARKMADDVSRMPDSWKTATPATLRTLLGKLETGIERSYQVSQALQKAQSSAIQQTNVIHRTHNAHRRRHAESRPNEINQQDLKAVARILLANQDRPASKKIQPREKGRPEISVSDRALIGKLADATGHDPAALKKELEKAMGVSQQPSGKSR